MTASRVRAYRPAGWVVGLALLFALMAGFVVHSARLGLAGLTLDLGGQRRRW